MTLHFKDMNLTFNEVDSQLSTYLELAVDEIYDRAPALRVMPGWTVVDVGANIGVFSVRQAQRGARVISFEPHPGAFSNLLANVQSNDVASQVTCVNVAVGSSAGTSWLSTATGSSVAHLTDEKTSDGIAVTTVTLDQALAQTDLSTVDLLKIDVEGAELQVIAGASATLDRTRMAIIEIHLPPVEVIDDLMAQHGLRRNPTGIYPNLYYERTSQA
jgi:FkbM family methyltransferase